MGFKYSLIAVISLVLAGFFTTYLSASSPIQWWDVEQVEITTQKLSDAPRKLWQQNAGCEVKHALVDSYDGLVEKELCVMNVDNGAQLAIYDNPFISATSYALKKANDPHFYPLQMQDMNYIDRSSGGVLAVTYRGEFAARIDDLATRTTEYLDYGGRKIYNLDHTSLAVAKYNGTTMRVGVRISISDNGRFLAFRSGDPQFSDVVMSVDMQTGAVKRLTNKYFSGSFFDRLAIGNDGVTVAIFNTSTKQGGIVTVRDECVLNIPVTLGNPYVCPMIDISGRLTNVPGEVYRLSLSSNNTLAVETTDDTGAYRTTIIPEGFTDDTSAQPEEPVAHGLEYLALGDSYSSGEGDISRTDSGNKLYIQGTDVAGDYKNKIPEEKCHISINSYPYLLRMNMAITNDQMKSVACSGAKIRDINGSGEYKGQDNSQKAPRLMGVDGSKSLQDQALYQFTPGRIQQIDFIRRYQPKVVTFTIGGNDTGFNNKVRACILNNPATTCATDKAKAEIAQTIKQQYQPLKQLYEDIQRVSPSTRIFVLGYPQFITNLGNFCSLNGGVSQEERRMMVEAVSYLNQVIKTAANNAGVTYVDVEDALYRNGLFSDHRLCGQGEDYVTGPDDYRVRAEIQELFHPNKDGHWAIYSKIHTALGGQKLDEANVCNETIVCPVPTPRTSEVPEYFRPSLSLYDYTMQAVSAVKNTLEDAQDAIVTILQQGAQVLVELPPAMFQPTTLVHIELNSEPIDLGEFTTAGDGSLTAHIVIPHDTPTGFHTLHIYGTDESGEKIDYYQDVEVRVPQIQPTAIANNQDHRVHQRDGASGGSTPLASFATSSAQDRTSQLLDQNFGMIVHETTKTDAASLQKQQPIENTHVVSSSDMRLLYLGAIALTLVIASCAVCVYTYKHRTSNRNE